MSELLSWEKIWEETRATGTEPTYPVGFQWKDYPSRLTPLSADNLNQLNDAIDKLDDRVVEMGEMVDEVANESESWAVGTRDGEPVPSTDPAYHNNSKYWKEDSEAYAVGTRAGTAVPSTDPTYHNNSSYYAAQAGDSADDAYESKQAAETAEGITIQYEAYAQRYANGTTNPVNPVPVSEGIGYHDNSKYYKQLAEDYTEGKIDGTVDPLMQTANAHYYKKRAEAWAIGKEEGTVVPSSDEAYNNHAKYWKEESEDWAVGTRAGTADPTHASNNSKYWSEESEAWAVGEIQGTGVPTTDPRYHNNSEYYSGISGGHSLDSEAWAVGERGGTPVGSTDPTYNNNSEYYAGQADTRATAALASQNAAAASQIAAAASQVAAAASAEEAHEYAGITMPHFHIDWESMELIQEDDGAGIVFTLDNNKNLTYEVVRS